MLKIEQIVNHPVTSNCYVISGGNSNSCIIVDPGTEDSNEVIEYLQVNGLTPDFILLSHEHVDHIIGCKKLQKCYEAKIVCSSTCANAMQSSKFNLTRMTEQWDERFSMPHANILLEDIDYRLDWEGNKIEFYKAEGHSLGSVYFSVGDNLFVGDTLIKGHKTTTVLPGASKEKLIPTLESLLSNFDPVKTRIFPGHFESFYLSEVMEEISEQIEYLKTKIHKKKQINQSAI